MGTTKSALRFLGVLIAFFALILADGAPVVARADSNRLVVRAEDYEFHTKGRLHPGWADVRFVNRGSETHEMAVLRIKPDVSVHDLRTAFESDDDAAIEPLLEGSPETTYGAPAPLDPQHASEVVTNQLKAGHYALVCFVSSPDGVPHFAKGMIDLFRVSGRPAHTSPPTADVTVNLRDSGITGVPATVDGRDKLLVMNTGTTNHSLQLVKLDGGKSIDDAIAYFGAKFAGAQVASNAPGALVGGAGEMEPGQSTYVLLHLDPGRYGFASTAGQGADALHGLKGEFTVNQRSKT